jgi:hypothetical protein
VNCQCGMYRIVAKMKQKLSNSKMVEKAKNGFPASDFYTPSVKGAFSSIEKTGRGSQSFIGSGASSSYSSYCKYRKEVMRQR